MNIARRLIQYIGKLAKRLDKDKLVEETRASEKELNDITIPMYEYAIEVLDGRKFQSDFFKDFDKQFDRNVKTRYRGTWIEQTLPILKNASKNAKLLTRVIDDIDSKDIITDNLTYAKSQMLRLTEAMYFLNRYSRRILIHCLFEETDVYKQNQSIDNNLAPAEIKWLENHMTDFMLVLNVFNNKPEEIEKSLNESPDAEIDSDTIETIISNVGGSRIDPNNLVSRGFFHLPAYYIRVQWEDWKNYRYELAKEERRMLEYQILDLKNTLNEEPDASVERELEYAQERVTKVNRRISKYEEEVSGVS